MPRDPASHVPGSMSARCTRASSAELEAMTGRFQLSRTTCVNLEGSGLCPCWKGVRNSCFEWNRFREESALTSNDGPLRMSEVCIQISARKHSDGGAPYSQVLMAPASLRFLASRGDQPVANSLANPQTSLKITTITGNVERPSALDFGIAAAQSASATIRRYGVCPIYMAVTSQLRKSSRTASHTICPVFSITSSAG
jgi:hypothetical protein